MTLDNVLQLFVIIGGTVGITFKISWAIFQEIHNNKKLPPQLSNPERSFLLTYLAKGS